MELVRIDLLNKINEELLNVLGKDIDLYVDYDGFNALVYINTKYTVYFIIGYDLKSLKVTLKSIYFDSDLEPIRENILEIDSLYIAMTKITCIIKTLEEQDAK